MTPAAIGRVAEDLAVGCAEILPKGGLEEKLKTAADEGRPLRVKLGIDPSGKHLTLGHAVVLRKLRQFQDAGHTAVLIIGDFTGQIGDPTGRTGTRQTQTQEETTENSAGYFEQVLRILDKERLEIRRNSEWLGSMSLGDILKSSRSLTVARLLERDDFAKRYKEERPITLSEFMYPMLQGLDSVAVDADIELGGTDQTYNNLVGRTMQREAGVPAQVVMTLPLLRGLDGGDKMGKSLDNWVAVDDTPTDQFGKILSISDDLILHFAELCCGWPAREIDAIAQKIALEPFRAKKDVARRVVSLYHDSEAADKAEQEFESRFTRRELPSDIPTSDLGGYSDPVDVLELLVGTGLVASKGEGRRLITAGAIKLDGNRIVTEKELLAHAQISGSVLQRGKLRAVRLV